VLTVRGRRLIASGVIDRGSLAVNHAGTRVYWLQDGQPASAPLP
jgi:hypothetical protein